MTARKLCFGIVLAIFGTLFTEWENFNATFAEKPARFKAALPSQLPEHPRLYLDRNEIRDLKAWIAREPQLTQYVADFIARMRKTLDHLPTPKENFSGNMSVSRQAQELALAYVLTDDPAFARGAADILRAYVEVMPKYKISSLKGLATSSALEESSWASNVASAYDLIYQSGVLGNQEKIEIEQKVLKASAEAMRICNHRYRSNWRARALTGVGIVGLCIADWDLIEESINGYYDATGRLVRDGFVQHVGWSLLADGVFYERSLGYQTFSLDGYALLMEAARHSGIDLWNLQVPGHPLDAGADKERRYGETGMKTIRAIFDSSFYETFGNGSVARIGNSDLDMLPQWWFYEAAWRSYRDPKYAFLINRGRKIQPPESKRTADTQVAANSKSTSPKSSPLTRLPRQPTDLLWMASDLPPGHFDLSEDAVIGITGRHVNACSLLPNGGLTILRQNAQTDAAAVLMTYGDFATAHTHPDQLAIVVYADERQLIPEVRYHRYGHADFLDWDRQTIAHNTVTVDEVAQYPQGDQEDRWPVEQEGRDAHSQPLFFHPGEQLKAFRARCDTAYDGVVLDRTIALIDSVIIDFFRCRSEQFHQYDYALHIDADLSETDIMLGEKEKGPVSEARGYRFLNQVRRGVTDESAATLTYSAGGTGSTMRLSFFPERKTELITAEGHVDTKQKAKNVLLRRRRGTNTDFVGTISFPEKSQIVATSQIENLPAGVLGVALDCRDGSQLALLSAEQPTGLAYQGQTFFGQLALFQSAGATTRLIDGIP